MVIWICCVTLERRLSLILKIFTEILPLLSDATTCQREPTLIIIQIREKTFSMSGMLYLQCGRGWSGFTCQSHTSNSPWNESYNLSHQPKYQKWSDASMLETQSSSTKMPRILPPWLSRVWDICRDGVIMHSHILTTGNQTALKHYLIQLTGLSIQFGVITLEPRIHMRIFTICFVVISISNCIILLWS